MYLTEKEGKFSITAASYSAEVSKEKIDLILAGETVASLSPVSCVCAVDGGERGADEDFMNGLVLTCKEEGGDAVFTWEAPSSAVWDKVYFILRATELRLEYRVKVSGRGAVDEVMYFKGIHGSSYEFDRGFTPVPTVDGTAQCEFAAEKEHKEFSYLTVPPMFVYVFDVCGISDKLAFALAAERGEHNFTYFHYNVQADGARSGFFFTTDQRGHTKVDGEWTTPAVLIYGSSSREEAFKAYADYYFAKGIADVKEHFRRPRFWYGPIACGWTEQAAYSDVSGLGYSQPDMARRETYDNFVKELEARDLHPTLMIIDDKWQTKYGDPCADPDKWRDLRAWIDRNREKNGIHTMLWYKLWDSEGLPDDECMASDSTWIQRVADPTNPKYRARLEEIMHRLLSSDAGCYNADGLKLDFAFFQPTGREAVSYSGKYGVELFLEYIKTVYRYAKEAKPDCVISASPCHPLFAPYVDHARLHDYHPYLRRCPEEFSFRRDIYHTALPWSLIDTDGAGYRSHRDTLRYLLSSYRIGIPDLYCVNDLFGLHITDGDWRAVANVWREYSEWADKMAEKR